MEDVEPDATVAEILLARREVLGAAVIVEVGGAERVRHDVQQVDVA